MQILKRHNERASETSGEIAHLRKVSLFQDIAHDEEALRQLSLATRLERYGPGREIVREGEPGSEMYILVEGTASVFKRTIEGEMYRVAILRAEAHSFFGEGALLDADARSATIRADSECSCLVLDRCSFETFGKKFPHWAFPVLARIARAVLERLRKTNEDLTLLYNALVTEIRGQ